MKNFFPHFICWSLMIGFVACISATPQNYFDQAVLNSNMLVGFANERQLQDMAPQPEKLNVKTNQAEPIKRTESLGDKIQFVEENLGKIKGLKETDETREMLQASVDLHQYVLDGYKTDYMELAKLYDASAPAAQTDALAKTIRDKYSTGFDTKYKKLIGLGKTYAAAHHIEVKWQD